MNTTSHEKLISSLRAGQVYRREMLLSFSNAVDRDLATLVQKGGLEKIAAGLYYKPTKSRYGTLPPNDEELVRCFLRDDIFLLFSWNEYNTLGLGLTQVYNRVIVYNRKRHGLFKLGSKTFDFRRPARGFPLTLTPEFLLVDLINNLDELAENSNAVKAQVKKQLTRFDKTKVLEHIHNYGKISTSRFFKELYG